MKKYYIPLTIGALALLGGIYYYLTYYQDEEEVASLYAYETEVDDPSECASFEVYDSKRKICSFECTSEQECDDLQQKADEEFASWADELTNDNTPVAEKKPSGDVAIVARYSVTPTETIVLQSGEDGDETRAIWDAIRKLSPDTLSNNYIEVYEVFNEPNDDTLAFVDDEDGNGKWRIAINVAGYTTSSDRENKTTIIHELAHIISLNTSQVNPDTSPCTTLKLDEGCVYPDSPLHIFWSTYWKDIQNPKFDKNTFVTEYATTNEVEDFAETFAFFVLKQQTELGTSIKDQKIRSLYSFPLLVAIREDMRSALSKDIIRKKKITTRY